MIGHSRDENIGTPIKDSVKVKDMDTLISKVQTTAEKLDESIGELKKINFGTGLITGVDLDEEGGE